MSGASCQSLSSRCNPWRLQSSSMLLGRLTWLPIILILKWGRGVTIRLPYAQSRNKTDKRPRHSLKEFCHFTGSSVDYGPKSIRGTEWNPFEIVQGRKKRSWSINRNHQSLGYSVLIRGGPACLFLGQAGGQAATFLPEVNNPAFCQNMHDLNW